MRAKILPDVNLLLALFVQGHEQQPTARRWYLRAGSPELIVCRLSQIGFLRLLTTPAMMKGDVLTNEEAWNLYELLLSSGILHFSADIPRVDTMFRELSSVRDSSPKRWSDAYLAAFALQSGLRLATFDKALASYTPGSILIPPA